MPPSTTAPWIAVGMAAWALWLAWPRTMIRKRSILTGKAYLVKDAPGAQDVADRLAALELRIRKFLQDAETLAPGDKRLANIRRRWNGTLSEIEHDSEVAYSMGKDAVAVCVRSKVDDSLETENTSMFVLLHELAHIATDKYGHTDEFWANMQFLLELADALGVYAYQNFESQNAAYCGFPLRTSPLTCVKNGSCAALLKK